MASLADIRARLAAQDNSQKKQTQRSQSDNAIYPFWNADVGTTTVIRFLPDKDESNPWFWVERQVIKLPFNGVKGMPEMKQVTVQVPCIEMYGSEYLYKCPVLAEVRTWYKDKSLEELANKYWKKRSFLFQGFVRQNPIGDDVTPANPIRRFVFNTQLLPIIKAGLVDPEISELPTHFERGIDFNIRKTAKPGGKYAEYTTSTFARRESPLTEAELSALQVHGLYNLADFLPKKPGTAELRIIKEMFDASVDGQAYDPEKWGAYYRPYGVKAPEGTQAGQTLSEDGSDTESSAAPVAVKSVAQVKEDVSAPFESPASTAPKSASSDKAADILAMIRARQTKG